MIGFVCKPARLGLALMLHPVEAGLPTVGLGGIVTSVGPGTEGPQNLVGPPLSTSFRCLRSAVLSVMRTYFSSVIDAPASCWLCHRLSCNSYEYLLELLGHKYMHSFVIIVLLQYHVSCVISNAIGRQPNERMAVLGTTLGATCEGWFLREAI